MNWSPGDSNRCIFLLRFCLFWMKRVEKGLTFILVCIYVSSFVLELTQQIWNDFFLFWCWSIQSASLINNEVFIEANGDWFEERTPFFSHLEIEWFKPYGYCVCVVCFSCQTSKPNSHVEIYIKDWVSLKIVCSAVWCLH